MWVHEFMSDQMGFIVFTPTDPFACLMIYTVRQTGLWGRGCVCA